LKEALEDYEHVKCLEPLNKETRKMIHRVKVGLGLAEEIVELEEEKKDPYTTMEIAAVDYGSDSDYEVEEGSASNVLKVEEPEEEEVIEEAIQAREMPAHLKKKGATSNPKNATQFEQVSLPTISPTLQ